MASDSNSNNDGDPVGDPVQEITHRMLDVLGFKDPEKENSGGGSGSINKRSNSNSSSNKNKIHIPSIKAVSDNAKSFERILAQEIYETNKEDRESILYEMHGVQSRAVPETPQMIQLALEELEQEISEIFCKSCSSDSSAELTRGHRLAVDQLNSMYVTSPSFRLRFLRHEFFNAKKAAIRYFRCLNHLVLLFGEVSLLRPLRIDDLSESERNILESGRIQVLLSRDRMGRRILVWFAGTLLDYPVCQRTRAEAYLLFGLLAEDTETQLHGAVAIFLFGTSNLPKERQKQAMDTEGNTTVLRNFFTTEPDATRDWDENEMRIFRKLSQVKVTERLDYHKERAKASPVRLSAFHACSPNGRIYHFFKALVTSFLTAEYRLLMRFHNGSHIECCYKLQQFGIPVHDIPGPSSKGVVAKTKSLSRILNGRAALDSVQKEHYDKYYQRKAETAGAPAATLAFEFVSPGTDCPESNCVVFGDRITYKYPANVAFREYLRNKEESHSRVVGRSGALPTSAFVDAVEPFSGLASAAASTNSSNNNKALMRLNTQVLDQIINELCVPRPRNTIDPVQAGANKNDLQLSQPTTQSQTGFRFATYDKKAGWYRYIDPTRSEADRIELRKRISQAMRDDRKRTMKSRGPAATNLSPLPQQIVLPMTAHDKLVPGFLGVNDANAAGVDVGDTFCFDESSRCHPLSSCLDNNELHAKRLKRHE